MPENFQFGSEHYYYFGVDATGRPQAMNGRPGDLPAPTHTYETFGPAGLDLWTEYGNIRDTSESNNNNTVNITTREDARQGNSIDVIATTSASVSLQVRYKPNAQGTTTPQDLIFAALLRASRFKKEIAAVDLDRPIDQIGAQGQVGNWIVAMSRSKPVEGVVVADVTLTLSGLSDWIIAEDTTGGDNFAVLQE